MLAGTGLVEAGTYVAILLGTILAGPLAVEYTHWAALGIIVTAIVGYLVSRSIPDAPPVATREPLDWNFARSSVKLIRSTMADTQVYFAILAISFFWTIGAVLFIQFPPLAKNVLMASPSVASLFLVIFSVGVALGSVGINRLLNDRVSARFAPASVLVMGLFVVAFYVVVRNWTAVEGGPLLGLAEFVAQPLAVVLLLSLLGIAVSGGMFVVPLYAFLTTRVAPEQTARTIAANNIVNSGAMVVGSLLALALTALEVPITEQVLLSAAMCVISAWLGRRLVHAERAAVPA